MVGAGCFFWEFCEILAFAGMTVRGRVVDALAVRGMFVGLGEKRASLF